MNDNNINNNNNKDTSAHETFADEDVNATDSLSGIEASSAQGNDPVRVEAAKNNNSSNIGPPLKGVLRSRGGRNEDASSSSGSDNDDEELTDSKPRSAAGSEDLPPKIAAREAKYVLASKFLVAFVLIVSAGLLGYFSYALTRADEEAEFEQKFSDYASEIVRSSADNARNSFTVLGTFARTITSLALYANKTWPFITLPDFEVRAQDYRSISSAEEVAFAPIVHDMDREAYEAYTVENQDWIQRGLDYEYQLALERRADHVHDSQNNEVVLDERSATTTTTIAPGTNLEGFAVVNKAKPIEAFIWRNAPLTHRAIPEQDKGPLVPVWQSFPAPKNSFVVNHNLKSTTEFNNNIATAISNRTTVLSDIVDNFKLFGTAQTINLDPKSVVMQPIFQHFHDDNADIVAFLIVITKWDIYFQHVLYEGAAPVIVVLQNSCGKVFSFEIIGPKAVFLGEGDFHDPRFEYLQVTTEFYHPDVYAACDFYLHIYPTQEMQDTYLTSLPIYVTLAVSTVFVFTTMVFILYDFLVTKRQEKVMASANATNRIVSNLFPKAVRDRLIQDMVATDADNQSVVSGNSGFSHIRGAGAKRTGANTFMNLSLHGSNHKGKNAKSNDHHHHSGHGGGTGTSEDIFGSKPIAELFPETTIMFADMVGFTAWSSIREPTHVFMLLETIYHAFDTIAKRRRVFKVETIGDCYVAVAGLPVPRKDHAVVMARFASECLSKMNDQVKHLEAQLGPDTGDLTVRVGLHSGAVTAGVLRGEKGRFQLFGDTMNTASRMESTGMRGRIQVSRETAALLIEADKQSWVTEREDKVHAKGKGELQTYWLQIKAGSSNGDATSVVSGGLDASSVVKDDAKESVPKATKLGTMISRYGDAQAMTDKMAMVAKSKRLVDWNTDILAKLLKQIIIRRTARRMKKLQIGFHVATEKKEAVDISFDRIPLPGLPMDSVVDIISLPHFDAKAFAKQVNPDSIDIPDVVMAQLSAFVGNIAKLYQLNAFHNFEHASHVTMSVTKLLSRIVQPKFDDAGRETDKILHDHTFGITSDPLTQFACVISALVHDADHQGVTNAVLIQENDPLASKYKQKSVAEQNSVDLAWRLLMGPEYQELRQTIYTTEEEFRRFRQIIVNIVLATDIMDKELGAQRKARWEKAFSSSDSNASKRVIMDDDEEQEEKEQRDVNRKATIVLEHLIQASDVAHTMQHWHVYRKWNERLFEEMYTAFKAGRLNTDPSVGWYKGEIGFFDFYIIPLAKKLETCGVFGVASSEYLGYAEANRREWEEKGEGIVQEYLAKYGDKGPSKSG